MSIKTITIAFSAVALCLSSPFVGLFYIWESQAESLYHELGSKNQTTHEKEKDVFLHAYLSARFSQFTNAQVAGFLGWTRESYHDLIRTDNIGGPQDYYNNAHASSLYEKRQEIPPFKKDINLAKDILKKIDQNEFVLNLGDPRLLTIKASFKNSKNFVTRPL